MRCPDVKELISDYADKQLSGSKQQQVEEHLSVCPSCRVQAEQMQLLLKEMSELPPMEPPAGLVSRAMGASSRRRRAAVTVLRRQVMAACMAGLLILAGNFYFLTATPATDAGRYHNQDYMESGAEVLGNDQSSQPPTEDVAADNDQPRETPASGFNKPLLYFNLAAVPTAFTLVYLLGRRPKGEWDCE